jgi:hypothetical protein
LEGKGEEETTAFHQRIKNLMKEMAVLHSVLRKKSEEEIKGRGIVPPSGPYAPLPGSIPVSSLGPQLNRLEDLQENVVDFEHNFCTRFHVRRDLGDRAKELYKDLKVREAQVRHKALDSSFFEL